MVNKAKLRAVMIEHGDTYESLAKAIGCTTSTFSIKINGGTLNGFTQPEMKAIIDRYALTDEEVIQIFFAN